MKRRQMILGVALVAFGMTGEAALADPLGSVVAGLKAQGYRVTATERTWLGRVRITAERRGVVREVVIDPRTGEVLRDLSRESGGGSGRSSGSSNSGSGSSGSGTSGSDDSGSHDGGSNGGGSDDSGSDDHSDDSGSDHSGGDSSDHDGGED